MVPYCRNTKKMHFTPQDSLWQKTEMCAFDSQLQPNGCIVGYLEIETNNNIGKKEKKVKIKTSA